MGEVLVNPVRRKEVGKLNPFIIYPPSIIYFVLVQVYAYTPTLIEFFGGIENKGTVITIATVIYILSVGVIYKFKGKRKT